MDNKNNTEFESTIERLQEIRKNLSKESRLKYPSPNSLNKAATEIIQLLKNTKFKDEDSKLWNLRNQGVMNLFKIDLYGELNHDYKKLLVRYKGKWSTQKKKIDLLISNFQQNINNDSA